MIKNYKNPRLEAYFNKYISQMSIDDKFKPYIVDILLRRAYQFKLTPEEIKTDVEVIMASLKEIKVVKQDELGVKWATAVYSSNEKCIKLGPSALKESDQLLYQTLTHEVYHALCRDPVTMEDRLSGGSNRFTGQYNSSLLETIVEKASFKTIFSTKPNNAYYNNNSRGYKDMTFILDAIEAVYGVNEQALLRRGIQSRDNLAEFLGSTIGENKEDTLKFLDKLEMHFSRLHRSMYPLPNNKNLTPDEKLQEIQRSLSDLKKVCEEKFADRIEHFSIENLDDVDLASFDFNKLDAIFSERANYFNSFLRRSHNIFANIEGFMETDTALKTETKKTFNRIRQLNLVKENISNIDPDIAQTLFQWAKYGNLENYNKYILSSNTPNPVLLEDMGIDFKKYHAEYLNHFDIDSNKFNEMIEERWDSEKFTAPWDNSIAKKFKKDIKQVKVKNTINRFFNKAKNIFNTKNKKQLYLPSGNISQKDNSKNDFMNNIVVSAEQLENIKTDPKYMHSPKTPQAKTDYIEFDD